MKRRNAHERSGTLPRDHLLAIADATAPARVLFSGARSHAGTGAPEIPEDGEGLIRRHRLAPFAVDATLVTNAHFAAFVAETGYVTLSEQLGCGIVFRGLLSAPDSVPPMNAQTPWWGAVEGVCWHAPEGPGSTVADRADHPVTHVCWEDARAFAAWANGRLPREAEWEHAARGGLADPRFPWGDREPDDTDFLPANIWQGRFPDWNSRADGWLGTSPVTAFAPNGAGLHDMAGNVWEWTADPFLIRSASRSAKRRNEEARSKRQKVSKGGSFLCHPSYCDRYRIAARTASAPDSAASNTGLRVFYDHP